MRNSDEIFLLGRIQRSQSGEWQTHFSEPSRSLIVENLSNEILEYEIVNDTIYFSLEFSNGSGSLRIPPGSVHEVKVLPNAEVLAKHGDSVRRVCSFLLSSLRMSLASNITAFLFQDKYIQENITVYNRNRPEENYWIALRLSFGHLSDFQVRTMVSYFNSRRVKGLFQ